MPGKVPIDRMRARKDAARPYDKNKRLVEGTRAQQSDAVARTVEASLDDEHGGDTEEDDA